MFPVDQKAFARDFKSFTAFCYVFFLRVKLTSIPDIMINVAAGTGNIGSKTNYQERDAAKV